MSGEKSLPENLVMSMAGSPETEHTHRPPSSGWLHWLQIGRKPNWSENRKIWLMHAIQEPLVITQALSPHFKPVVGANQNHLGALFCENTQTNLGHQVAEMCSIK